jgi:hypothetical protein
MPTACVDLFFRPVAGRSLPRKPNRGSDGDLRRRDGLPRPVAEWPPVMKWPQVCNLRCARWPRRSGLSTPRRRTFAAGILPSAHSDVACAPPRAPRRRRRLGRLRWSTYAGSRGTGSPELTVFKLIACCLPAASPFRSAAGRRHAQKPVSLVDAGRRHVACASNSQVPPALSMSPTRCGASKLRPTRVQVAGGPPTASPPSRPRVRFSFVPRPPPPTEMP